MSVTERVDLKKHPMAKTLEAEVLWQAEKLAEARALIRDVSIVISYDNGGGQKGIRKNPAYDAYAQLFASFVKGMTALDAILAEAPPESNEAKATLENLRVIVNDRLRAAR